MAVLLIAVLGLGTLSDAACAIDRGWNRYHNSEFDLTLEYPAFLNDIEQPGTPQARQWKTGARPFMKLWSFKNCRYGVSFFHSDDSGSIQVMSVSVIDNPDGYDLKRCATELATARIEEVGEETYRVEYDSLMVGGVHAIHVRSWTRTGSRELQWANLYVFRSNGRVFSIYICDACMKSLLTDEFGDYDSVVDRILASLKWVD